MNRPRSLPAITALLLLVAALLPCAPVDAQPHQALRELAGEPADWHGYDKYDFSSGERASYVVVPEHPAPGNPWVWRARFPGFHAEADRILLDRGFHVAFTNTNGLLGHDTALDHWDLFYEFMVDGLGLSPEPALEGVSRGGLFVYRWAARNPDKVSCIYADTPVCDARSWPGGLGEGRGAPREWQRFQELYGLTQEQAQQFASNPIDLLEPIAQADIPLMHIVSLNDVIVPPTENTFVLAERYRELGGHIEIIEVAQGTERSGGHHFTHPDPVRVADFIELHAATAPDADDYFTLRGSLDNCRIRFERDGVGKVVFVGGSITVMENGWRQMTMDYLRQRFPDTEFTFVNAGISSTGSPFGSFRLLRDAFAGGPPDLLFEEAAVNDLHVGQSDSHIQRGMEGLVRHIREASPTTDVVVMHFAEPRHSTDYRAGNTPSVIGIHEPIAERYAVPTLNLAREVPERIDAGQFTWEEDFRNLHPSPYGHRLYASSIRRLLSAAWAQPLAEDAEQVAHALPEPIDSFAFSAGQLIAPSAITNLDGFELIENCDPRANEVGGRVRPGFHNVDMLVGDAGGDGFSYTFTGRGIGLVVVAGPDAGQITYRVDDGDWQILDASTRHRGIHLPRLFVLADELDADAEHTLEVRLVATPDGSACRIVNLAVNGP